MESIKLFARSGEGTVLLSSGIEMIIPTSFYRTIIMGGGTWVHVFWNSSSVDFVPLCSSFSVLCSLSSLLNESMLHLKSPLSLLQISNEIKMHVESSNFQNFIKKVTNPRLLISNIVFNFKQKFSSKIKWTNLSLHSSLLIAKFHSKIFQFIELIQSIVRFQVSLSFT